MYREEGDDDVVDFYDDLEFLKGLGMGLYPPIAYYWVGGDEGMIQYWVPMSVVPMVSAHIWMVLPLTADTTVLINCPAYTAPSIMGYG